MSYNNFVIVGACQVPDLYFCRFLAQKIKVEGPTKKGPESESTVDVSFKALLEVDFYPELDRLKVLYGGDIYAHNLPYIVLVENGQGAARYIGGIKELIDFARESFGIDDADLHNDIADRRSAREDLQALTIASKHKYVFLEFAVCKFKEYILVL